MKVLDEALVEEQEKVNEVRRQIDEFKERINAQNQEISKRLAGKEQREAQVTILVSKCHSSVTLFNQFIGERRRIAVEET